MKKQISFLLMPIVLLVFITGCAMVIEVPENGFGKIPVSATSDGGLLLTIPSDISAEINIQYGDSIDILLNRDLTLQDVPYYSGPYAEANQPYLTDAAPDENGAVRFLLTPNNGQDLWTQAGLRTNSKIAIAVNSAKKYERVESAHVFFSKVIRQYSDSPFQMPTYKNRANTHFLISGFSKTNGLLTEEGVVLSSEIDFHSQLIPVYEGKTCYVGFRDENTACIGAFYNEQGQWCAPLKTEMLVPCNYKSPNGIAGTWHFEDEPGEGYTYVRTYCFSVPKGACYVSLNLNRKPEYAYRQFLSTEPVFAHSDTGNYVWTDEEPLLQQSKNQRVCIIGQSSAMIDRCLRALEGKSEPWTFLSGFQEYLIPWFSVVDSFGFSGKGYMKNGSNGIFDYLVDGNIDLSGYDLYLLLPGSNALTTSNMGDLASTDPATYFGAINLLIEQIQEQNLQKKEPEIIMFTDYLRIGSYRDENTMKKTKLLNSQLLEYAKNKGYRIFDVETDFGMTEEKLSSLTYDGTHPNQIGSMELGLLYRSYLLNF